MGIPEPMQRKPLSDKALRTLANAGWTETWDRSADLEQWERALPEFTMSDAARDALRRYGGVQVRESGAGEEWARNSFHVEPTLCWGESDRFADFEAIVGTALFPLGEIQDGHVFLAIGADGRVFGLMMEIGLVGETMEDAIEALTRGLRWTPLE